MGGWVRFICPCCQCEGMARTQAFNRAQNAGLNIYCGLTCSRVGRRKGRDELHAKKAAYDKARRIELADRIKAEKAEYYQRTHDPVKEAAIRKTRMPKHVEYCRRPEYVEWKAEYDRQLRAKEYGEFSECYLLTLDLRREVLLQATRYEIGLSAGTLNKTTQRKRDYDRTHSNRPEIGSLGNPEIAQGGQYSASRR